VKGISDMRYIDENFLSVRPLTEKDAVLLLKWLTNPVVLEFYEGRDRPLSPIMVRQHFYDPTEDISRCIVEYESNPIGYLQFYQIDEEERLKYGYKQHVNLYGMDQFIGETAYWNRGIGSQLVTAMKNYLFSEKEAEIVVLDPQKRNKRAIACYEKCGFKKVKLLPENELHEGVWQDCWLMEAIKE